MPGFRGETLLRKTPRYRGRFGVRDDRAWQWVIAMRTIMASAVLAFPFSVAVGDTAKKPKGRLLFTYGGKAYTCEDLTLVPYREGLKHVAEARASYDWSVHQPPASGWWIPSQNTWRAPKPDDFQSLYHHQLNGIINIFVRYEVLKALRKQYPLPSEATKRLYDPQGLQRYTQISADVHSRSANAIYACVDRSSSLQTFRKRVRERVQFNWADDTWKYWYEYSRRMKPYMLMSLRCFPFVVNHEPAPWYRKSLECRLLQRYVVEIIKADPKPYIDKLEMRFGKFHVFVVHQAFQDQEAAIAALLEKLVTKDGKAAAGGVSKANATFGSLKSPTRFAGWYGPLNHLPAVFKIPKSAVKFGTFIPLPNQKGSLRDYLYIPQRKPVPHFKTYDPNPPGFLYDCGYAAILTPLFERVTASMRPAKGFLMPKVSDLLRSARTGEFRKKLYGFDLPKVFRDAK